MVDNLQMYSRSIGCPMKSGRDIVRTNADAGVLNDDTHGLEANDRSVAPVIIAYLSQLWMERFAPLEGALLDTGQIKSGYFFKDYGTPLNRIEIALDTSKYEGDLTYGGMNYANYGVISFATSRGVYYPVQWVNFPITSNIVPQPLCEKVQVWLKEGLSGQYIVYGQTSVPDIQWNEHGTAFVTNPWTNKMF